MKRKQMKKNKTCMTKPSKAEGKSTFPVWGGLYCLSKRLKASKDTDVILLKFLEARECKVNKAYGKLKKLLFAELQENINLRGGEGEDLKEVPTERH